ncbi:ABC transporter substrate-binding protein [Jiangella muralis]|uniref:ABC transporter substrate-binding protein n=1 Tax=Jiangella muralis TaxID=702383 RepID=UPI00069ED75F|nr:sugar ABC transporter substrate-binding protein [Jiangella muralis]
MAPHLFDAQVSRRSLLAGTASAAMLALAGCGGGGNSSSGGGGTKTITLLSNNGADREPIVQSAITAYEDANPGTKITVLNIADGAQFNTKVKTQALADSLSDVFYVRTLELAANAKDGWLTPLGSHLGSSDVDPADFYPAVQEQFRYQGEYYALPEDLSAYGIYVNTTMFDELGIPVPTGDWTWTEFYELAEEFAVREGSRQTRWGGYINPSSWGLRGIMRANGGEVFNEDGSEAIVDNAENAETFSQIGDAAKAGAIPAFEGLPTGVDAFAGGLVAMFMNGSWYAGGAEAAIGDRFEWAIVSMPKGTTGKREIATAGGGWGMSKDAKDPDGTWAFLEYLTSADVQADFPWVQGGALTARQSDPARDILFPEFGDDAGAFSYPPLWTKYELSLYNRMGTLLSGENPSSVLAQIQEETNR